MAFVWMQREVTMGMGTGSIRSAVLGLAAMFLVPMAGSGCPSAVGQFSDASGNAESGVFIPAPRELRQRLIEAQESVDQKRFSDAVMLLGELLAGGSKDGVEDDLADQDFFIQEDEELTTTKVVGRSVLRDAEAMIGQLPSEGREVYELRYGSDASQLLQSAIRNGDATSLAEVSRRYFHTKAGYEATMLLAYRLLVEGRPRASAAVLERLYNNPTSRQRFDPALSVLLAICWQLLDRPAEEMSTIEALVAQFGGQTMPLGPANATIPRDVSEARRWLKEAYSKGLSIDGTRQREAVVSTGGPFTAAYTDAGLPLSSMRWMQPTVARQRDAEQLAKLAREESGRSAWPIPTLQPIAVGNTVIVKTASDLLMGIDLASGKVQWYPWYAASQEVDENASGFAAEGNEGAERLRKRVWEDVPYGRISSDGQRIFALHGMEPYNSSGMMSRRAFNPFGGQPWGSRDGGGLSGNVLHALELSTEGKLLWSVGGPTGLDQQSLQGAFFLGPPLAQDGQLFVLAEQNGDISLLVLEPSSGRLLWRQHLISVESSSIEMDPVRRVAGAQPVAADGILVCPTGHGAVVAVDLVTRTLRWGFRYRRSSTIAMGMSDQSEPFWDRWLDSHPVIANGKVILTPVESDQLFCLDLLTGEPAWHAQQRDSMRVLQGVVDGIALLTGGGTLFGVRVDTGLEAWKPKQLDANERFTGRGVAVGDRWMLPTSAQRVLVVGPNDGEVVSAHQVNYPLGNLLIHRGNLVSQSESMVVAAFDSASLEDRVAKLLAANATDREALLRRGQLAVERGMLDEGLAYFGAAYRSVPDEETRVLYAEAMLRSLKIDFAKYQGLIDRLETLCELPEQRKDFLRLLVDGLIREGKAAGALQRLVELAKISLDEDQLAAGRRPPLAEDERHAMQIDAWIAGRVARLAQQDGDLKAALEPLLKVWENSGIAEQLRVVHQFGALEAIDGLRIRIVEQAIDEDNATLAERVVIDALGQWPRQPFDGASLPESQVQRQRDWRIVLAVTLAIRDDRQMAAEVLEGVDLASASESAVLTAKMVGFVPALREVQSLGDDDPLRPWLPHAQPPAMQRASGLQGPSSNWLTLRWNSRQHGRWQDWTARYNSGELGLLDGLGGPAQPNIRLDPPSTNDQGTRKPDEAIIDGAMMVAALPVGLVGVDLSGRSLVDPAQESDLEADIFDSAPSGGDKRVWRRPLISMAEPKVRSYTNDVGDRLSLVEYEQDNVTLPLVRLGPVTGRWIHLVEGMNCRRLDLLSGEEQWSLREVDRDATIFGTAEKLAIIGRQTGAIRIVDASDGSTISQRNWEPKRNKLWNLQGGRHALTAVSTARIAGDGNAKSQLIEVRLIDPLADRVVLSADLAAESKGNLVDGQHAVMLEPGGRLHVWDIDAGVVRCDLELGRVGKLRELNAFRLGPRLVIFCNQGEQDAPKETVKATTMAAGPTMRQVRGLMLAVDLRTGKLAWEEPLKLSAWSCFTALPTHCPLMFLLRQMNDPDDGKRMVEVMALDVRTGKQVGEYAPLKLQAFYGEANANVAVSPSQQEVQLNLYQWNLAYRFANDPPSDPRPTMLENAEATDGGFPSPRAPAQMEQP
jgi:outer membrane protein assembly factor BamB